MESLRSWIYHEEIHFLHNLQSAPLFSGSFWEEFWLSSTKLGDPAWTFLVYFPLLFSFRPVLSLRFLLAGAISEFVNGVLKWLLHGERPFWYVFEENLNEDWPLRQFRHSCETGPGSPSGHVMVTSCVFYVLIKGVNHSLIRKILWVCYALLLCLVGVSRLFIGAHFPHQVLLGLGIGVSIGHLCSSAHPIKWSVGQAVLLTLFLSLIGGLTYYGLIASGFDPDWSIGKAMRWCVEPKWIHLSTHPLAALFRDVGALLGLALGISTAKELATKKSWSLASAVAGSFLSLLMVQLLKRVPLPRDPEWSFYVCTLLLHLLLPSLVIQLNFLLSKAHKSEKKHD